MNIDTIFDPTTSPIGSQTSFVAQTKNGGFIIVMNMSNVNLQLTFGNGKTTYVPANDRRKYEFNKQMAQPYFTVTVTLLSTINVPQSVNRVIVESYQPGEYSVEMYPAMFIRSAQVATQ